MNVPIELSTDEEDFLDLGRVELIRVNRHEICSLSHLFEKLIGLNRKLITGLYLRIFLELKENKGFLYSL